MKLSQSHVVAGAVALAVLSAGCWILMTEISHKNISEPGASVPNFDPNSMVGHGELVQQLLKLLTEVAGEPGSAQRLAAARRVEKAILKIEAKIDRPWTEQGKKQSALIQYCRDALKAEIGVLGESAGRLSDLSETTTAFILFACGVLGWASTKWVNQRYATFITSNMSLKLKTHEFYDSDDIKESPAHCKGTVTLKAPRKGSMSPKSPKRRGKNVRHQRASIVLADVAEVKPVSTSVVSASQIEPMVSAAEPVNCIQPLVGGLAIAAGTRDASNLLTLEKQDGDCGCGIAATRTLPVPCVSSTCAPCGDGALEGAAQLNTEYGQNGAAKADDDVTEYPDGEARSPKQSFGEQSDADKESADNGVDEEPQENDTGYVYAPCAPGAPLQKFWPLLINGEQFYTDGKQIFRMACIPLPAASEVGTDEQDMSTNPDAEDGMSTTSDSDVFTEGVAMTRSRSEPSFSTQWIE